MEAVINASREIAVGDAAVAIAGGVESMTRAPWVVQKPDQPYERGNQQMHSTTLGWRMVNPRHPAQWTVALGEGAEILADEFAITARCRTSSPSGAICAPPRRGMPDTSTPRSSRRSAPT